MDIGVTRLKIAIESNFKAENQTHVINTLLHPLARDINKIIQEHETSLKNTKSRFNIFNCLTKHHLEELHSNFLVYLLNPISSHDCGTLFLKLFLDSLSKNEKIADKITNRLYAEISLAKVTHEKRIGYAYETDLYGKIDILIETPSFIIAIENKINAIEQPDQIYRYATFCKNTKKTPLVFYLTKYGNESFTAKGMEYYPISYALEICDWLDLCSTATKLYPNISTGISQYQNLVKDKILNMPSQEEIHRIKDLLLKDENKEILKYLTAISSAVVPIRNEIRKDSFNQLSKLLIEQGLEISPYKIENNRFCTIRTDEIWGNRGSGFIFNDEDLSYKIDQDIKLMFCIEHNWNNLYCGLVVVNNGNLDLKDYTENVLNHLNRLKVKMNNNLMSFEDGYYCWKFLMEDFSNDDFNYQLATETSMIVNRFLAEVIEYLNAWKGVLAENYIPSL